MREPSGPSHRLKAVKHIERHLSRHAWPRLGMLAIMFFTAAGGFMASLALLHFGMRSMMWRYALAVAASYAVFLSCLKLWLNRCQRLSLRAQEEANEEAGYGSGESALMRSAKRGGDVLEGIGNGVDLAELCGLDSLGAVLGVIMAVLALALGCWLICAPLWDAPSLLAEMLFDLLVARGLWSALQAGGGRYWLHTALRRTFLSFALIAALAMGGGALLQSAAPGAVTLGGAIKVLHSRALQ